MFEQLTNPAQRLDLLGNQQLRVADNVDEEDVADFQPNFLFYLRGHWEGLWLRAANASTSIFPRESQTPQSSWRRDEIMNLRRKTSELGNVKRVNARDLCFCCRRQQQHI